MLETTRLYLRPPILSDAQNLFILNSDPRVMNLTGDSLCSHFLDARKLIEEKMMPHFEKHKMGRFMVFLKDGSFIGWCGLKFHPETNEVDLGYRFMPQYWGQGFATEASLVCLDYAFHKLNLSIVIGKSMPENTASIKVLQKIGMSFKGYLKDPTDPCSFVCYDILRGSFKGCAV